MELKLEYHCQASAPTLFDSWTTAPVAERWLFKNATNQLTFTADVKEGGRFSVAEKDDDTTIDHFGQYLKIDRPHRLVFSLEVPAHFEGVSEVTVNITEQPSGSLLTLTQKNIDTTQTEAAWHAMLGKLADLVKQPYLITEQSEKDDIVTAINVVAMQAAGFAIPLDELQINTIPFKNSWTAAQCITHVTKSISGLSHGLKQPGVPAGRDPGMYIIGLKQTFLDITHTMQSPEFIIPEEKKYDKASVLSGLQKALKKLNAAAENIVATDMVPGLPLGPVTKLEIIHFLLFHTQRHLIQMKRITDAVKNL